MKHRLMSAGGLAGLAFLACLGVAAAEPIKAVDRAEGRDHEEALEGVDEGRLVPLETVIASLAEDYPGEFLDASLHEIVPGEPVYKVIWLTPDRRKLTIWVDALTGEVIRVEGED